MYKAMSDGKRNKNTSNKQAKQTTQEIRDTHFCKQTGNFRGTERVSKTSLTFVT